MYDAIGCQRDLEQRAREAAPRLDEREEALGRVVEPLEDTLDEEDDLAHEAVFAVRREHLRRRRARAARRPPFRTATTPTAGWLNRRSSSASSSSRHARSAHALDPARASSSGVCGSAPSGARIVRFAVWAFASTATETYRRSPRGSSLTALAGRRLLRATMASRRRFTAASKSFLLGASSTTPHSTARFPRTPSATVENTSARSRRTLRLSTRRVSPPVPGSTPRSGASGRLTALDPSSCRTISSHAIASS